MVPRCRERCLDCIRYPFPKIWYHPICYEILEATYHPSDELIFSNLGRFAAAIKPMFEPVSTKKRDSRVGFGRSLQHVYNQHHPKHFQPRLTPETAARDSRHHSRDDWTVLVLDYPRRASLAAGTHGTERRHPMYPARSHPRRVDPITTPRLDQSPWYNVLEAEHSHPEAYVSFDVWLSILNRLL